MVLAVCLFLFVGKHFTGPVGPGPICISLLSFYRRSERFCGCCSLRVHRHRILLIKAKS